MSKKKPKRCWYQFNLRTMFALVTIVSILLAWVGYSLNWIKQRHAAIESLVLRTDTVDCHENTPPAPKGLWLFGEQGVMIIYVQNEKDISYGKQLFPEASVRVSDW